jgi:hypothetical protein
MGMLRSVAMVDIFLYHFFVTVLAFIFCIGGFALFVAWKDNMRLEDNYYFDRANNNFKKSERDFYESLRLSRKVARNLHKYSSSDINFTAIHNLLKAHQVYHSKALNELNEEINRLADKYKELFGVNEERSTTSRINAGVSET